MSRRRRAHATRVATSNRGGGYNDCAQLPARLEEFFQGRTVQQCVDMCGSLSIVQLKNALKAREQPVNGRKQDLVLRLQCYLQMSAASNEQEQETEEDFEIDTHAYSKLVNNPKFSDVTFSVGPARTPIHAHRVLLAARSPVFAAMFFSQFAEASVGASSHIPIPDIEAETFEHMLHVMYTDEVPSLSAESVVGHLLAARKYQVEVLRRACVEFMSREVDESTALLLFESTPEVLDEERETYMCYAAMHADAVVKDATFFNARQETLAALCGHEDLSITEDALFHACLLWAKVQKMREQEQLKARETPDEVVPGFVQKIIELLTDNPTTAEALLPSLDGEELLMRLKDCIPLIRFPLMNLENLACRVQPLMILENSQLLELCTYVSMGTHKLLPESLSAQERVPDIPISRELSDDYDPDELNVDLFGDTSDVTVTRLGDQDSDVEEKEEKEEEEDEEEEELELPERDETKAERLAKLPRVAGFIAAPRQAGANSSRGPSIFRRVGPHVTLSSEQRQVQCNTSAFRMAFTAGTCVSCEWRVTIMNTMYAGIGVTPVGLSTSVEAYQNEHGVMLYSTGPIYSGGALVGRIGSSSLSGALLSVELNRGKRTVTYRKLSNASQSTSAGQVLAEVNLPRSALSKKRGMCLAVTLGLNSMVRLET